MSDLRPAGFETADYRSVLRRLTTLDDEAAGLRAEAQIWHDGRVSSADDAVHKADEALKAAERSVTEAQRELEEVDARAAGLWADYVHKAGPRAERYGRTKPEPVVPHQRDGRTARDYLDEVSTKMKYTAPARPITFGVKVLFGVFGFAGGLVGAAAYQMLRTTGGSQTGTWRDALPVIALLVLLACPVLAVVAAKKVADHRSTALDASTIATVLITGLITAGAVLASVRSPK